MAFNRFIVHALEPRVLLANAVVIDLLAVFTPGAVSVVGSEATLRSRIQDSVDYANRAMSNSKIALSIRLVHADPITYTGSGDLLTDRDALAHGTGGLSAVAALRNTYGADLVTLITESAASGSNTSGGGNGDVMTSLTDPTNASTNAFSAVAANSIAPYNSTLAHELGHNLGAQHDRANAFGPTVTPYAYGYRFTAPGGHVYHDIMAYPPGDEVPYFANPAVSFRGAPTGSPVGAADQADLAKTFAQTAPIVAAYRAAAVPDTTAPTAAIDNISVHDGFAYVTVRYADDTGIDISTIDSTDIALTVPGLSTPITPALDSIENAGVGGQFNRATYRAYLRDVPTTPGAISVTMNANAVRDEANLAVPAGTLATTTAWTTGYSYALARDLGTIAAGSSLLVGDSLKTDLDNDDVFQFNLGSATTISTRLTGMSADGNVFIAHDTNGDGVYEYTELIDGSYRTGSADESFTLNLAAGTYFAWVFGATTTPYALQLTSYTDTTLPVAKLDVADITSPTSNFVFNVTLDDNVEINAYEAAVNSPVRLTTPFGGYYFSYPPTIDADVNGPHRVLTYTIPAGHMLSASDNGVYTVAFEPSSGSTATPPQYVDDGAGNVVSIGTIGTFHVAIGAGQTDTSAPTIARFSAPAVWRGGGTSYDFDVTFAENRSLIDTSLAASQVTVTGPDHVARIASVAGISPAPTVGTQRTVHYHLASLPGGSWDAADFGTYTLTLVAGKVKDAAGNTSGALAIGSFKVTVPLAGDANGDGTVGFDDLLILAKNYGTSTKTFAAGNFNDDPAGNVDFDDLLLLAKNYGTSRPVFAGTEATTKPTRKRATADVLE